MLAAYKEIEALERAPVETYPIPAVLRVLPVVRGTALVLLLAVHVLDRTRWRVVP